MIVSLLSENLQKKLLFVSHAVSSRSQLPILLNFLIEAKKGVLKISATDLEIGITTEISARVQEEGTTTVLAKTFLELMGTIPQEKITLSATKGGLGLRGEKIKTVFQTVQPEEFPSLFGEKGEETLRLKEKEAEKIFSKIIFAAGVDTSRPALTGVLIKNDKEKKNSFVLVSTDGYRLSFVRQTLEKGEQKEQKEGISLLVPSRVIREVILMGKEAGEIKIYVSKEKNQIIFSQNGTTLVGRLIEAEFPAYEKIIPEDYSTKTTFDCEELRNAVKACYIFARETANIVKLSVLKDKIVVSANAPSVGENSIEIDAKTEGEENEVAFNARYLLDLFANIEEETMSFEMTGPLSPGVFRIIGEDSFFHLIMPIRIQQE